ncbi:uncharacterized protein LOC119680824 [Teleopsis dalmanni]|uniref:uncharacterized protein LOC119680824 n=1 Tax=Teleopsis dalmanni TaxID=139649 RepID=UPI0018CD2D4D|nr:uncharacterized protein LOC119680824 [Teleopsis dalmanni]
MNLSFIEESFYFTKISYDFLKGVAVNSSILLKTEIYNFSSGWKSPIEFTPLQFILLKLVLLLIFSTALLIAYSWHIYGRVITEKFVRPSTLKEIEELKRSVANLKLPKEHSPRI